VKDINEEHFYTSRDLIAIYEERLEMIRRKKVASGEWQEANSMEQLQKYIVEMENNMMGPNKERIFKRDMEALFKGIQAMDNPERLLEREYHFDESLGKSLSEHIEELK